VTGGGQVPLPAAPFWGVLKAIVAIMAYWRCARRLAG